MDKQFYEKGGTAKKTHIFLVFAISQPIQHQNFKNLIPTSHNTLVWGRDKDFQVLMLYELRNCEEEKNM